jgi:chromosome segregation ATPase
MMVAVRQRVDQAVEAAVRLVPARPFTGAVPPAPWWTVLAPWPHIGRLEVFIADLRTAHGAERAGMAERLTALEAEQRTAAERITTLAAEAERHRLAAVHAAEQLAAEQAERAGALHRAETAERLRSEAERAVHRLREEFAEHAAERPDQRERAERSNGAGAKATRSVAAANAPRLTDDEAVQAMLRVHRSAAYEWTKREVHRITGAGFGRVDRLIAAVAEHHAREAERGGAEQPPGDRDDSKERSA